MASDGAPYRNVCLHAYTASFERTGVKLVRRPRVVRTLQTGESAKIHGGGALRPATRDASAPACEPRDI